MRDRRGFSTAWVFVSLFVFVGVELVFGGYLAHILSGRYISHILEIKLEVFMSVGSYFVGGFLIGMVSPDIRVLEPAIGAALAVLLTFAVPFFSPLPFVSFFSHRAGLGSLIAFGFAIAGADLGERLAARLGNRESKRYTSVTGAD